MDSRRRAGQDPVVWLAVAASAAGLLYDPLAAAADVKRAALLTVGGAALAVFLLRPQCQSVARDSLGRVTLLWLTLVGCLALSTLHNLTLGVRPLGTWVGATALLLVALQLPRYRARTVARGVGLALGSGAALAAVWEYGHGARGLYVHGGQGNPNWLGLLLAMTLPLAMEQLWRYRRRLVGVALGALGTLQGVGLYLSHSRVAWAALAVAALVTGWPALAAWSSARSALAGLLLVAVLLGGLGRAGAQVGSAAPAALAAADPVLVVGAHDTPLPVAWAGRVFIWKTSLYAAARAWPFGVGLGGFPAAYLDEQGRLLARLSPGQAARRFVNATTAHNDWLEAAVDAGILAPLLLLATLGCAFWQHFRSTRRRGRWRAGAAVLVACAVCASGDSPLQQPAIMILLALVLAAAPRRITSKSNTTEWLGAVHGQTANRPLSRLRERLGEGEVPSSGPSPWPSPASGRGDSQYHSKRLITALYWGVLIGASLLLAPATSTWLGARLLSAARTAQPMERQALLARAARVDPRSGEIAFTRGLDTLLLGDAEAALPELARARPLLANVSTDVAMGNAELLLGSPRDAAAAYNRALQRHPGSFRAHANLALALSQLGDPQAARQHLQIARSLQPGHPKLAELEQQLTDRANGSR